MIELPRIEQWLYGVLASDAAVQALIGTRVYAYLAPQGAKLPYVVFSYQGGHDVRGVGPGRVMVSAIYQVKAVGEGGSFAGLKPIVDALDGLLQGASGSVVDGAVLMCTREQPLAYVETDSGVLYRHLGGLWRIIAR